MDDVVLSCILSIEEVRMSEPQARPESQADALPTLVHVVFKTHLDVGFTDYARNVVARYFDSFIPQALQTARRLRESARPERFIWTTGSWLIYEYLEKAGPARRREMEVGILAGDIAWHALPFTTHTELMDASLFRFGLSLARRLDERFGRQTIAAKLTDVPGHTRAMLPVLAEAGVQFLHMGVNGASPRLDIPQLFRWKDEETGVSVMVAYQPSYGQLLTLPGFSQALIFAHTIDNIGPQSDDDVLAQFSSLRQKFPGAEIRASTLDDYAHALKERAESLPIITDELGDTWIHGVGTDPTLVRRYRQLARLRQAWLDDGRVDPASPEFEGFSRYLLRIPEHTWGMDEKTFLMDYIHYRPDQLTRVLDQPNFRTFAASWQEKHGYLEEAVRSLDDSPLAHQARAALDQVVPDRFPLEGYRPLAGEDLSVSGAHFSIGLHPATGAIHHLVDKASGREWAGPNCPLGLFRYQSFSQEDYDRYLDQYLAKKPEWAILDFSKPGIREAGALSRMWDPEAADLFMREDAAGVHLLAHVRMPTPAWQEFGCPEEVFLLVELPQDEPSIRLDLRWFGKQANRLPEAVWFTFQPATGPEGNWMFEKMGRWISPRRVIERGNRHLHAVEKQVHYADGEGQLRIETLDAPLAAPGKPALLCFDQDLPAVEGGVHFNLYNNIWGTNFPMWFDQDARFRFTLTVE
jgi:hypothetical protein